MRYGKIFTMAGFSLALCLFITISNSTAALDNPTCVATELQNIPGNDCANGANVALAPLPKLTDPSGSFQSIMATAPSCGGNAKVSLYHVNGVEISQIYNGSEQPLNNFDAIEQVQVIAGGFAAQFGESEGGVVFAVTQSPENQVRLLKGDFPSGDLSSGAWSYQLLTDIRADQSSLAISEVFTTNGTAPHTAGATWWTTNGTGWGRYNLLTPFIRDDGAWERQSISSGDPLVAPDPTQPFAHTPDILGNDHLLGVGPDGALNHYYVPSGGTEMNYLGQVGPPGLGWSDINIGYGPNGELLGSAHSQVGGYLATWYKNPDQPWVRQDVTANPGETVGMFNNMGVDPITSTAYCGYGHQSERIKVYAFDVFGFFKFWWLDPMFGMPAQTSVAAFNNGYAVAWRNQNNQLFYRTCVNGD